MKMDNIYTTTKLIGKRNHLIEKIANKVLNERGKILDDFMLAYCVNRNLKKSQIQKLELVEERTGAGAIYWFRLKRGRPKTN